MSGIKQESRNPNSLILELAGLSVKYDRQVDQILKVQRKFHLLNEDYRALHKSIVKITEKISKVLDEIKNCPVPEIRKSPNSGKLKKVLQDLEETHQQLQEKFGNQEDPPDLI